jgi:SAM-dependent methyltransferase
MHKPARGGPARALAQALPAIETPLRRLPAEDPSLAELPFDIYQRYRLTADIVRAIARRSAQERLVVLDVGGGTGVLRRFLPEHAVMLVDVEDQGEPGTIQGSGSALPFADDAFDLVVTCDTLEHVPPAERARFLAECARCARRGVIVAGPYRHERVDEAEETLRAFLRIKLGIDHRYLEEHRTHGLPGRAETEAAFRFRGADVASFGHGNLERWLALLCASMYMEQDRQLARMARDIYRFYNEALYESDRVGPVYRHAVVALFDGSQPPTEEEIFGRAATHVGAPAGTLEPFTHLAAELFAFDRERDVYDTERARLDGVVNGLVLDLDGHRGRIATLEDDLAGHRTSLAESEHDLAGHRASLAALAAEREAERSERERERAHVADIARDLDGHRAALATRTEELAHAEAQRAAQEERATSLAAELERVLAEAAAERAAATTQRAAEASVRATLEADLAGHRDTVTALRAELEREGGEARALAQRVHELDEVAHDLHEQFVAERNENEGLRRAMRSRWGSLMRTLRLR